LAALAAAAMQQQITQITQAMLARFGAGASRSRQGRREPRGIVPKMFRQYAKRYGTGVEELSRAHKKFPAPMLDHWRDRLAKKHPDVPRSHG